MPYCAVVIRKDDDRPLVYSLEARSLSEARREAQKYLARLGRGLGRLELFALPGSGMPRLIWTRSA